MNHVLDTEPDKSIQRACYIGFSKLILHGQHSTRELVSKFLIAYFNPATDSEINQILGIFFSALASRKKQDCLADALIPTLKTLIDSPYDSPLREVKIENVVKFVVNLTRPVYCSNGLNLHNVLYLKLLEFITDNIDDREVTKVIPKELMTLEISDDPLLRKDLIAKIGSLIENSSLDVKSSKIMTDLKKMLEGTYRAPLKFSSTAGQIPNPDPVDELFEEIEDAENSHVEEPKKPSEEMAAEEDEESQILSPEIEPKPCSVNISLISKSMLEEAEIIDESGSQDQASQNSTLIDATENENEDSSPKTPEKVPEIPKTPAITTQTSTRRSMAKRQIYTPKTFESPLHKRKSGVAGASFSEKTMLTPRTPNFTLANSNISTPNTDRQTRARTRAENDFNSKTLRSQSANAMKSAKMVDKNDSKRLSRSQNKK